MSTDNPSPLTELIEILNCDDGIIPLITGEDAAKVVNKLQSLIARKEREAMLLEAKHRCDDALGRLLRLDRDKTIEYLNETLLQ